MKKKELLELISHYNPETPIQFAYGWHSKGNSINLPEHICNRYDVPKSVKQFRNWLSFQPELVDIFNAILIRYENQIDLNLIRNDRGVKLLFGAKQEPSSLIRIADCLYVSDKGLIINRTKQQVLNSRCKAFLNQILKTGFISHDLIYEQITDSENTKYKISQKIRSVIGNDSLSVINNEGYSLRCTYNEVFFDRVEELDINPNADELLDSSPFSDSTDSDYFVITFKIPKWKRLKGYFKLS
ncbi:hypothetical protein [Catenovulum maritimum]|uniref:Uncharacterized protein n=1 Tax=Catenovulum maritimum TaxID=1513271 RepID=A0A0J8JJY2_9ALTE|nr:hypothetical protein [Catenovulum maritimum]KMT64761.1 hypothetical protein XM47_12945 [Catenovulum maritimum]